MILRLYGSSYQSVDLNFDSKALNEVVFRRNHERSIAMEDFDGSYVLGATHELQAEAQGDVQDHTEQQLLDRLREQIGALLTCRRLASWWCSGGIGGRGSGGGWGMRHCGNNLGASNQSNRIFDNRKTVTSS